MATTKVSILSGTSENEYLDEVDSDRPTYRHVSASIMERTITSRNSTDGSVFETTVCRARISPEVEVAIGDRLRDENTGDVWLVDNISRQNGIGLKPPTVLMLRAFS